MLPSVNFDLIKILNSWPIKSGFYFTYMYLKHTSSQKSFDIVAKMDRIYKMKQGKANRVFPREHTSHNKYSLPKS